MQVFGNNGHLIESIKELPDLKGQELVIDFETTSGDPKLNSLNPWFNCKIAGICITTMKHAEAWYIPLRHRRYNLSYGPVREWFNDMLSTSLRWINHNIKYDVMVALNEDLIIEHPELVDTLTLAKIVNSDRYQYSLSSLSHEWLDHDISHYEERLKAWLRNEKSKDYGDVPAHIMAEYGCQDVLTTKRLYQYILDRIPEQCQRVVDTEIKLTSVLCDIERKGMRIDPMTVKKKLYTCLRSMIEIEEKLHELTATPIRPHTNADCFDVLCNRYGLPVLGTTDKGDPSFDKYALASYTRHPEVKGSACLKQIVKLLLDYRKLHTLHNFFLVPYSELAIDGVMHPSYNQSVRTGRMSCRKPNAQQLSIEAKELIIPAPGMWLMDADYSQIEFRIIVHYINNLKAIAAYLDDPHTDFHVWVAEMCGITRSPAKNINFCMGFGGGKKRVLTMLEGNMELMKGVEADNFKQYCKLRAKSVYMKYHDTLPELKQVSNQVARVAQNRGYVYNLYGRHRHLPMKAAWRAFNSIVQASAADMIKEAVVNTSPRFNPEIRATGSSQIAVVHDDILFETGDYKKLLPLVRKVMESPSVTLRIPIKIDSGVSNENWAKC